MLAVQSFLRNSLPKPSASASHSLAIESAVVDTHVPIDVIGDAKGSSHKKTPWNPSEFELWVEHGVVWDLKQLMIMGFIDYASIAPYFKSTLAFRANTGMFKGSPFSLSDFPVYGYMGPPYIGWIFSALHMLTYLPTAWYLFRGQGLTNGKKAPPAGAGPVASAKDMGFFRAGSPSGTKTFSAKYVAYMWQLKPTAEMYWPPS